MKSGLRTVLVTGARGALGGAVTARFLEGGCKVVATDLPADWTPPAGATWLPLKLSDSKAVGAALAGLPIDGLVHCAGGFRFAKVDQVADADLDFLIDANLRSTFHVARALLPGMRERNFGRMTFISSAGTLAPGPGMAPYAASKAGVNMLVTALAAEVKKQDINVNAVMPTTIDTPANRRDMPNADFSSWVPLGELADIIFQLMQPWGRTIHGALIPVAGRV
jgi:3-oxoacyl-[acyl-carrier protein] reductase